jgi:predicted DNA-binding ribbon-helix-helix protein
VHTTTVRFSEETWRELKEVCERDGIATAQYIREATIARLAVSSGVGIEARVARLERLMAVVGHAYSNEQEGK